MMKDLLPVNVITEINSFTLESANRFQTASPICHVTITVEGIDIPHKVTGEEIIPITSQHELRAESNGPDGGGIYAINGNPPVPVDSGESMVIGVYQREEEVGVFRITGS